MKKFLAGLLITGLICTAANATYEYKFNNAGAVINGPNQFGQNASFTPQNRARAGAINRAVQREKAINKAIEKGNTVNVNFNSSSGNNDTSQEAAPKSKFLRDKFRKVRSKN